MKRQIKDFYKGVKMLHHLRMEGEKVTYDDMGKTLYVVIQEPFYSAGKKLGWNESKTAGLGFNKSIITHILKFKCHMVVNVGTAQYSYWIHYDRLKKFIEDHNCNYTVSGKELIVISWETFVRLNEHCRI